MVAGEGPDEWRIPLVEEQVSIGKREVETDRVRIHTVVDVRDASVEAQLLVGRVEVERVAVEREVAEAPAPRQEGDTLVIPVVEERLVVEKRLFVVEEVRVTRIDRAETFSTTVPLRTTRVVVERSDPDQVDTGRE